MKGKIILTVMVIVAIAVAAFMTISNPEFIDIISGRTNLWGSMVCDENGTEMFKVSPIAVENIEFIEPMGAVTGSHVLPVDHTYWHLKDPFLEDVDSDTQFFTEKNQSYDIRAPADGNIVLIGNIIQWHTDKPEEQPDDYHVDYDIAIEHSCSVSTYMIHIDTLRNDILEKANFAESSVPGHLHSSVFIPVKEGEIIGTVSGAMFDFSVHDTKKLLDGFIFPKHYRDLRPKLYSQNIYDYFEEPLRSQLLEKNIRKEEPYGGKIDYDIEGHLVGNWFKENTNYHAGIITDRYWDGHLAIVYDHVLPDQIRVSMGDYGSKHGQFSVKGNSPDPAGVTKETETVKYELMDYWYYDEGKIWRGFSYPENLVPWNREGVMGTILLKVLEGNKLKMEVFPGKTGNEVSGFTENARIYER